MRLAQSHTACKYQNKEPDPGIWIPGLYVYYNAHVSETFTTVSHKKKER